MSRKFTVCHCVTQVLMTAEQFGTDMDDRPIHLGIHLALLTAERYQQATSSWPGAAEGNDLSEVNRQMEETALSILRSAVPDAQEVGEETIQAIAET